MSARSVPEELVQAAAEALRDYYGETSVSDAFQAANREAARLALQAAFAKLPECEAAVVAAHENHYGSRPDDLLDRQQLRYVLAALAGTEAAS